MKTILSAKKIYLMAFGESKKQAIKQAILGDITDELPASFLQRHDNVSYCLDFNINIK
jgi:glucosamine-6-phosphate deaminase